jgi:hypothetical protein
MALGGGGLEGLTSNGGGGGGVPDSPLILQAFGVVGAPELAFLGDEDTGLYRPAVNTLGLVAGGVELATISALGNAQLCAGTDPAADGGDLDLKGGDSGVAATGDGGAVNVLAGSSVATAGDGGVVSIKSGAGIGTGAGGDILVEVGEGGAAGPGTSGNLFINTLTGVDAAAGLQVPIPGLVSIYGIGRSGEGPAGNLELWGGYANGSGFGSDGGDAIMWGGGQGGGAGFGGNAMIIGGEGDSIPGEARVIGGQATVAGGGGNVRIAGGGGFGAGNSPGGDVSMLGGEGFANSSGAGGTVLVRGGVGANNSSGGGGDVAIRGGQSLQSGTDGGSVTIDGGLPAGAGDPGDIVLALAGSTQFVIDGVSGIHSNTSTGPAVLNEAATNINPVLVPDQADLGTGIGHTATDQMALIARSAEIARVQSDSGGNEQFIVLPGAIGASAALPAFAFGDGDTGFNESSDDQLGLSLAGSQRWFWSGDLFGSLVGTGAGIRNEAASATNPTVNARRSDDNSGLGSGAADQIDLIAGGLSCMSVRETGGVRQMGFYTTAAISLQTGVAVTASGVHAALVALGLITA